MTKFLTNYEKLKFFNKSGIDLDEFKEDMFIKIYEGKQIISLIYLKQIIT